MFQVPGRRADSLRIGRYTNFLDTTAQLEAVGSGEKVTYLGLQKVNDVDRARAIAADMQSGGTAVNVWCILPDGQVARP